jgi:hypothetical protein
VIPLDWLAQPLRYRDAAKAGSTSTPVTFVPEDNQWKFRLTQPTALTDLDNVKDVLVVMGYSVTI